MNKIHVGFSYPKKFKIGAFLIARWQSRNYSHVYLRFESSNPKIPSYVYHAAHGMVHFLTYENFLKSNDTIKEFQIDLSQDQKTETIADCMDISGEKYGTIELLKIFISDIVFFLCKRVLKFKNSPGYICSELVGDLLEKRLNVKYEKPMFLLKPSDIEKALKITGYQENSLI